MNGNAAPSIPPFSINNPLTAPTGSNYSNPGTSQVPSYPNNTPMPGTNVGSSTGSSVNKGPLARKYPSASSASNTYGGAPNYQQPMFNPLDYNQPGQTNTTPAYNYG